MKNTLLCLCAFVLVWLSSCSTQETQEPAADFFITSDLSFLLDGLPPEAAKSWPANGCKEVKTTMLHCCVNYVCNSVALTEVLDFFLGDKTSSLPSGIEVLYSERFTFEEYGIRIHPGTYQLDHKTGQLKGLEYEVRVNR